MIVEYGCLPMHGLGPYTMHGDGRDEFLDGRKIGVAGVLRRLGGPCG